MCQECGGNPRQHEPSACKGVGYHGPRCISATCAGCDNDHVPATVAAAETFTPPPTPSFGAVAIEKEGSRVAVRKGSIRLGYLATEVDRPPRHYTVLDTFEPVGGAKFYVLPTAITQYGMAKVVQWALDAKMVMLGENIDPSEHTPLELALAVTRMHDPAKVEASLEKIVSMRSLYDIVGQSSTDPVTMTLTPDNCLYREIKGHSCRLCDGKGVTVCIPPINAIPWLISMGRTDGTVCPQCKANKGLGTCLVCGYGKSVKSDLEMTDVSFSLSDRLKQQSKITLECQGASTPGPSTRRPRSLESRTTTATSPAPFLVGLGTNH